MDRTSDSGSDGCGSIPHGGTKKGLRPLSLYPVYPQSLRDSHGGACKVICTTDPASGNTPYAREGHSEASESNGSHQGR